MIGALKKLLVGEPLTTDRAVHERLSVKKALAVFSSDALSSVAYATDAILLSLSADQLTAQLALPWVWPISMVIVCLLWILVLSYRQTISAYPGGGGAYIVCRENFGKNISLTAAAALIIDYILTVAVSIAAGTAAVTSAFPQLLPHAVLISNTAIFVQMLMNIRGVRESGTVFSVPTYIFIFSMYGLFMWLGYLAATSSIIPAPLMPTNHDQVGWALLLLAFANGCTALTGVEAISNGVPAFKHPEQENAKKTLLLMGIILTTLFLGVSYFSHFFSIVPTNEETAISQLARLPHSDIFYFTVQAATAAILFLAANTAFNDFPRVASLLADDRYLPRQLASRGDRLVFSNGIIGLGFISMFLIWLFSARVEHLLPLYAIGVFLCFTLSQAGMVKHWLKHKGKHWQLSAIINAIGCATTTVVLAIQIRAKVFHGGLIVCMMVPFFVFQFRKIKFHYLIVGDQLRLVGPPPATPPVAGHHVIIPVSGIHKGVVAALHYARSISRDITACYIDITPRVTQRIKTEWEKYGMGVPLTVLNSPYRSVIRPLLQFVETEIKAHPHDMITVIIPEFVTAKWWQTLLHNQTAIIIRTALAFKPNVVVTSVRYHLAK